MSEIQTASDFNQLEIADALKTLALYGGNYDRAARLLSEAGRPIGATTLRKWSLETYAIQYEEIVHRLREDIGSKVSDGAMEVATSAQALSAEMVDRLRAELHEVPAKDLAKAALNIAQTSRTNVEVARLLRNQPTSITEVRSIEDTLDTLKELDVIDVDPADVQEEDPA